MPTNYAGLVYGPIFRTQAVAAHLIPRIGATVDVLALDDTGGVEIEDAETLRPVARVRYADLAAAAIAIENLDKGTITLTNPITLDTVIWRIDAARIEPTPSGRGQGMVMLILQGK
jgi:hypothetical protein